MKTNYNFQQIIWWIFPGLAAILVGHILFKMPLASFLLLAASIFMLTVFIKPLFGLIASIPLVLYFSYIDLIWVSPWNYLIVGLGGLAIVIYHTRRKTAALSIQNIGEISDYTRRIYLVSFLFLVLITIINLIQAGALVVSIKFIPLFFIAFCTMVFIRNEKDLKLIIYCIIGFMGISAFVGIMQFLQIDFFWRLRETFESDEPVINLQILQRQRVPGLAYFNIPFAYQLANVVPLVFALLLSKAKKTRLETFYLITAFLICFFASIISKSKSLVIAIIITLAWCVLTSSIPKKKKNAFLFLLLATFVLMATYFLFSDIYEESETSLMKMNAGNLARIPLFWAGFRVSLENPWGVGAGNFNTYAEKFYPELKNMPGADNLLVTATHNQFLNALVYYGVLGLILIILFYYFVIKGILKVIRHHPNSFIEAVSIGLLGSFLAYLIHSMFHNAGPFAIDPFNWYFVGLAMFLFNNYARDLG